MTSSPTLALVPVVVLFPQASDRHGRRGFSAHALLWLGTVHASPDLEVPKDPRTSAYYVPRADGT